MHKHVAIWKFPNMVASFILDWDFWVSTHLAFADSLLLGHLHFWEKMYFDHPRLTRAPSLESRDTWHSSHPGDILKGGWGLQSLPLQGQHKPCSADVGVRSWYSVQISHEISGYLSHLVTIVLGIRSWCYPRVHCSAWPSHVGGQTWDNLGTPMR